MVSECVCSQYIGIPTGLLQEPIEIQIARAVDARYWRVSFGKSSFESDLDTLILKLILVKRFAWSTLLAANPSPSVSTGIQRLEPLCANLEHH